MDKGGLGSFGLSNPFQADAATGSQLEPDFDHLDAPKLVKQLPRGHAFGSPKDAKTLLDRSQGPGPLLPPKWMFPAQGPY
jgi:hypothetical protein